jgi:hypothetical protein
MPSGRKRRPVAKPWVWVLLLALFAACTPSGGGPAAGHSTSGTASPFVPAHQVAYDVTCPGFDPSKSPLPADLPAVQAESAGAIAGAFSVSHGGEATYTMPLAVPPGRAGMKPRLSVTYSSWSGHGILGMGFSLQGLSAIARCPSNIAQDGAIRPVRYDVLDHLCLDGSRLVAVGAKTGVVPQVGPTTLEYRTFPDSFAKVVAHFPAGWDGKKKGPQFFEVFTKAGRILEYGATASGQELAKSGIVAAWWLTREKDRRGNAISYTYHNDTDPTEGYTVEHYPDRIDYTSHPNAPASSAVIFGYGSAITPNTLFRGGMKLLQSKQLSQIQMVTEPGDVPVRTYEFYYKESPGTGRGLLQTLSGADPP